MKTFLITSLLLVACDQCSQKEEDSAAKDSAVESPVEEVEEAEEEPKDTSN
tara:strand:+ start:168 stop:320 length:153 start_codon:yes stop_codon:yes gene_type:complete